MFAENLIFLNKNCNFISIFHHINYFNADFQPTLAFSDFNWINNN